MACDAMRCDARSFYITHGWILHVDFLFVALLKRNKTHTEYKKSIITLFTRIMSEYFRELLGCF